MIRTPTPVLIVIMLSMLSACSHHKPIARRSEQPIVATEARAEVTRALDALHDAASKAEGDRYFALFAPDAVFIGTDASERWTLDQFKAYALPLFAQGMGWTYRPTERHVAISQDGWAWFDELLENGRYGTCRGSGVLRQYDNGAWLIEQYDLSVPIPNEMLRGVAEEIRTSKKESK